MKTFEIDTRVIGHVTVTKRYWIETILPAGVSVDDAERIVEQEFLATGGIVNGDSRAVSAAILVPYPPV